MICSECGKDCEAVVVDEGIGPYEFWGNRGVDVALEVYSDCCEATVIKSNGTVYDAYDAQCDREADEGDRRYEEMRDRELMGQWERRRD
jgi:hypothetical protein